jgi:hypothetical protein
MLTAADAQELALSAERPVVTVGWQIPVVNAIEKQIEFLARNGKRIMLVTAQIRLFLQQQDRFDVLLDAPEYEQLALIFRERGFKTSEVHDWGFEIRW